MNEYANQNPYAGYDPNFNYDEVMAKLMQLQYRIASTISNVNGTSEQMSVIEQTVDKIGLEVFEQDANGIEVSSIDILKNQMSLTVAKDDYTGEAVISMINLTPDTIKIQSGNIDLTGAVSIGSLNLDLKEYIEGIEEQAQAAADDISDLSDDLKLTPAEQYSIQLTWDEIVYEHESLVNQSIMMSVSHSSYDTAYNNLEDALALVLTGDTYTFASAADRDNFNAIVKNYFTAAANQRQLISGELNDASSTALARYNAWKYGATTFIDGGNIYTGTVNLKGVNVYDYYGVNTFSIDSNGNVTIKGHLDGATGTFTGTLSGGSIEGTNVSTAYTFANLYRFEGNLRSSSLDLRQVNTSNGSTSAFSNLDERGLIITDYNSGGSTIINAVQIDTKDGYFDYVSPRVLNVTSSSTLGSATASYLKSTGNIDSDGRIWGDYLQADYDINAGGTIYQGSYPVATRTWVQNQGYTSGAYSYGSSMSPSNVTLSGNSSYIWQSNGSFYGNFVKAYGNMSVDGFLTVNSGSTSTFVGPVKIGSTTYNSTVTKKTNIKPFEDDAIDLLKSNNVYSYHLKASLESGDYENEQIGLLSESSSKILRGSDSKGVNPYAITSVLWRANQTQQEHLEKHDYEIDNLYMVLEETLKEMELLKQKLVV